MVVSVSLLILIHYMDSCANNLVFPMSIWLTCSWSRALYCRVAGILILLLFCAVPSVTAMLSLNDHDQYGCIFCWWPPMYHVSPQLTCSLMWSLSCVACLISSAIIHSGMSLHVSVTLIFRFIHRIPLPLSLSWLCHDNQSAINSCSPGLYKILMLYWWMYSRILSDRVVISFLKIATSGLWSIIMLTSQAR